MDRAQDEHERFQFKLMHLFVLTTAIALVMGVAVRLISPALFVGAVQGAPTLFLLIVAAYAIVFGGWLVLRGPRFYAQQKKLRKRRRDVAEKQAELKQLSRPRGLAAAANSDLAAEEPEGN